VDYGDFFDFFLPWFQHKGDDNVLFLTYEYLVKFSRDAILRIARFLGQDFEDQLLDKDEALLHGILNSLEFQLESSSLPKPRHMVQVGEWRSIFTDEQSRRMDERFQAKTNGSGAEHMWADVM
jgi:hypothetical protein